MTATAKSIVLRAAERGLRAREAQDGVPVRIDGQVATGIPGNSTESLEVMNGPQGAAAELSLTIRRGQISGEANRRRFMGKIVAVSDRDWRVSGYDEDEISIELTLQDPEEA